MLAQHLKAFVFTVLFSWQQSFKPTFNIWLTLSKPCLAWLQHSECEDCDLSVLNKLTPDPGQIFHYDVQQVINKKFGQYTASQPNIPRRQLILNLMGLYLIAFHSAVIGLAMWGGEVLAPLRWLTLLSLPSSELSSCWGVNFPHCNISRDFKWNLLRG